MSESLLSIAEVRARLGGCHRATVYRMVAAGDLPAPVKIGTRSTWPESEVEALIERLKQARNAGQIMGQTGEAA